MEAVLYAIGSVIIVSLCSLIGAILLVTSLKTLSGVLKYFVSFAAGALIGDAFIHLLPEAIETYGFELSMSLSILSGMVVFFIMEKVIHWHHCHLHGSHFGSHVHQHAHKHHTHPFAVMNLIGDGVHNFMDGMIIGVSYLVSVPVGIATTIAVILHEIPQELGDFGVLLEGGFSTIKALAFNLLSAFASLVGVVAVFVVGSQIENLNQFLIPFGAGGFIYIAAADLIPHLHKEVQVRKSLLQLLAMCLGVAIMVALVLFE